MSGNERQDGFDKRKDNAPDESTPASLRFDEIMKGPSDRQQEAGDTSAIRIGNMAYLNSDQFQKDLKDARKYLSQDVRDSIAAAVSVPAELKEKGVTDPVENAKLTAVMQQEQIDNYAKTIAGKSQDEQLAEAVRLSKYIDKLGNILAKAEGPA